MKKSIIVAVAISALSLGIQSCRKCDGPDKKETTVTQTVNVTLKTNESYTFSLPENRPDDPFTITTQAAHFKISETSASTNGNSVYSYTPSLDFSGTDQVIISTTGKEHHGHGGGHQGGNCGQQNQCQHNQEQPTIVTINFTIINPSSSSAK